MTAINRDERDEAFDRELASALAALWDGATRNAPAPDAMLVRLTDRPPERRLSPVAARLIVLGLLLILAAVVAVAAARPSRPIPGNGPIALGAELRMVDPLTGSDVAFSGCRGCTIRDADWSPDGSTLLFVDRTDRSALMTWRPGDDVPMRIWTCAPGACGISRPVWSPDGRRIVASVSLLVGTGDPSEPKPTLVVLDADGTHARRLPLVDSAAAAASGSWTPDGDIVFATMENNLATLGIIRSDFGGYRVIVRRTTLGIVAVSPDGRSIAYFTAPPRAAPASPGVDIELWVADIDGRNSRRLWVTSNCCLATGLGGPEWSPDGTKVAITGRRADATTESPDLVVLTVIDVPTGTATILGRAVTSTPAWRPIPLP